MTVPRKLLSGASLAAISEHYLAILQQNLAALNLHSERWLEIPDLYAFVQDQITRMTFATVMGSEMLEHYPDIVADFWGFDRNIENFTGGAPRFMIPSAFAARDRWLKNLKEWDRIELKKKDAVDDDLEWTKWGSNFIRTRKATFLNMPAMDEDARASESVAILLGYVYCFLLFDHS